MSYRRRRRAPNKGKKCVRRKRVHVRGHGYAYRCAKYSSVRSYSGYGSKSRRRRRGRRPYNKGKTCKEWGRNKLGRRTCRSYGKVYGAGMKNRRRSRPGDDIVKEQRTYENRMRRMMYENEPAMGIPSWWVT